MGFSKSQMPKNLVKSQVEDEDRTRAIITRGLYIFYPLFILKSGLYYRQFMV